MFKIQNDFFLILFHYCNFLFIVSELAECDCITYASEKVKVIISKSVVKICTPGEKPINLCHCQFKRLIKEGQWIASYVRADSCGSCCGHDLKIEGNNFPDLGL